MTYEQIQAKVATLLNRALADDVLRYDVTVVSDLRTNITIRRDGPIGLSKGRVTWMGMKMRIVCVPVEALAPDKASSNIPMTAEPEPFCLSLDVVKDNGRHVYYDDPDTDPRYL